jgi:predicted dehydrogenase
VRFDSVHPDEFRLHQRAIAGPEANWPRTISVGPEEPSFGYTILMPARGVGSGYGAAVAQAQDFLAAIAHGRGVKPEFWDAYRTMPVCDAAQKAAADGGPVVVGAPA